MNIKLLNDLAKVPTRGSEESAGWDLYAAIDHDVMIPPHQTVKIGTGIAMELAKGTFGAIYSRSGLATKQGLRPANCVGVVDSDYRGEVIVALHNDTDQTRIVHPADRIAQLIISLYVRGDMNVVETLSNTDRGSSGFGSTGA